MEGEFGGEMSFGGESGPSAPDISIDSTPIETPVIDEFPAEAPFIDELPGETPQIDELSPVQVIDQPPAETQEPSESTGDQPVVDVPQEDVSVSEAASVEDSVVDDVPPDQPAVEEIQEAALPEPPIIDEVPDGTSLIGPSLGEAATTRESLSPSVENGATDIGWQGEDFPLAETPIIDEFPVEIPIIDEIPAETPIIDEIPDETPIVGEIPTDGSDKTGVMDDTSIPAPTPVEVADQEIPEEPTAEPGNDQGQADEYHPDPGFVPDPSDPYSPDPGITPDPYGPIDPYPRIEPDPTSQYNPEPQVEPGLGDPYSPEQGIEDTRNLSDRESEIAMMETISPEIGPEGQNWKNPRNVITPERQEDNLHSPESLPGVDPGTTRKPLIDPVTPPQPSDPLNPTPENSTSTGWPGAGDKPAADGKQAGTEQPAGMSDISPEDQQLLDQIRQQREDLEKEIVADAAAFDNRPHLVVPEGEIPDYSKPHLVPDTVIRNLDSHLSTIKAEDIAAHEYPNTPVQELPDNNLKGVAYEGIVQNAAQDLAGSQGNVEVHPEGMTTVTGKPIEPDEIITTSDGSKVILDAKGYTLKDTQNPDAAASSLTHIDGIKNVSKYTGADVDNLNEVAVALPYETASKINVQEAVAGMGTPDVPMTVVPISDEQTLKQTMTDLQTPPDERWDIPDDFFPKMDEIESLPLGERQQAMGDLLNSYNDSKGDSSAARRNIQFYATVEPNSSGLSIVDKSGVKHTVRYK